MVYVCLCVWDEWGECLGFSLAVASSLGKGMAGDWPPVRLLKSRLLSLDSSFDKRGWLSFMGGRYSMNDDG